MATLLAPTPLRVLLSADFLTLIYVEKYSLEGRFKTCATGKFHDFLYFTPLKKCISISRNSIFEDSACDLLGQTPVPVFSYRQGHPPFLHPPTADEDVQTHKHRPLACATQNRPFVLLPIRILVV